MNIDRLINIVRSFDRRLAVDDSARLCPLSEIFSMLGLSARAQYSPYYTRMLEINPAPGVTPRTFTIPEIPKEGLTWIHRHLGKLLSPKPVGGFPLLAFVARPLVMVKLLESGFFGKHLGSPKLAIGRVQPPWFYGVGGRNQKIRWEYACQTPGGLLDALDWGDPGWWKTPISPSLVKDYFVSKNGEDLVLREHTTNRELFANLDVTEWAIRRSGLSPEEFRALAKSFGVEDLAKTPILLGYILEFTMGEEYVKLGGKHLIFDSREMWHFALNMFKEHPLKLYVDWLLLLKDLYQTTATPNKPSYPGGIPYWSLREFGFCQTERDPRPSYISTLGGEYIKQAP